MAYLTWQRLALVGLSALALAWLMTEVMTNRGASPEPVPWTTHVVVVVAGGFALWLGWQVRQYLKGNKPGLDGLRAARTAVYAQACAYLGAILTGAYGGYALGLMDQWSHAPRRAVVISALLGAASALVLLVAGAIAEQWCRHNREDDETEPEGPEPAGASPA